jgi:hypothetical protein
MADDFQTAPPKASLPVVCGVDGSEIPLYTLLHINPEAVRNDFQHAATWQATVAYAAAVKRLALARLKRRIKKAESVRFLQLRDLMTAKLGKAPSNELVDHNVRVDPKISDLWDEYEALEEESEALESARFALYARREMLISMGAETRLDRKLDGA